MNGYEVMTLLGCGGFGEVYLVEKDNNKSVLKVVSYCALTISRAVFDEAFETYFSLLSSSCQSIKEQWFAISFHMIFALKLLPKDMRKKMYLLLF